MNFAELRAALFSYTGERADYPFTTLVQMAESKFASTVQHRLSETYTDLPVAKDAASVPLPADFQTARSIKLKGIPLTLASIDALDGTPGLTNRYVIVGNTLRLQSPAAEPLSVALTYYARVPALTETAPTNWLSTTFPDVYLYGTLVEFAIWSQDPDKQAQYAALLIAALANLSRDHAKGSFSGSTLQTRRF